MASLGDLVVNLKANRTDFDKGMQLATKHMAAFAAAAGAAATAAVYKFAAFGDELHKNALRTGIAVESLSAMNYAAGQSGASVEAVAKSFAGLARFTNDLRRGSATAADAMGLLGLELDAIAGLTPEQSYRVLADAISAIEDPLLQGAAAQQIFGRSGRELLPMLKGGSAEIDRLSAKAERLGAVFDQEAADGAAAVTDAMDDLNTAVKAASVRFGAMFAPAVTAALTSLADLAANSQGAIQLMASLAAGVAAYLVVLKAWTLRTKAQAAAQVVLNAVTTPLGILKVTAALTAASFAVGAMRQALADTTPELERNNVAAAEAAGIANDLADGLGRVAKAQKEKPEFVDRIGAKLLEMRDPAQKAADEISRFEFELKKLQQYTGMAGNIPEDVERFRQHASGYVDALRDVQDEIAVLTGQTTEQQQAFARMQQFGISGAQIAALDAEIAKRDRIIAQQREQEQAMTQAQRDADAIIQSLKTEDQLQADKAARIKELQALGLLSAKQAQAAIDALKPASASEDGTGTVSYTHLTLPTTSRV